MNSDTVPAANCHPQTIQHADKLKRLSGRCLMMARRLCGSDFFGAWSARADQSEVLLFTQTDLGQEFAMIQFVTYPNVAFHNGSGTSGKRNSTRLARSSGDMVHRGMPMPILLPSGLTPLVIAFAKLSRVYGEWA